MATASWKIALPALAFGNAVIWKPANITPASAWAFTEIIHRQAIPAGLFNLLMGPGSPAIGPRTRGKGGDSRPEDFTGSGEVGSGIAMPRSGAVNKLQLEMGSKNPLVIMDDAISDRAVDLAVNGAFGRTGQKCTASSRLIVHRPSPRRFRRAVPREDQGAEGRPCHSGRAYKWGQSSTRLSLTATLPHVALAPKRGRRDSRPAGINSRGRKKGYYMFPTDAFLNTKPRMRVKSRRKCSARSHCVFCPSPDLDEAIEVANDTLLWP